MPTDWEIVNTMEWYGGSFVQALAQCCARADPQNLERIKAAFPDLWQQYAEMAELAKERDAESRPQA